MDRGRDVTSNGRRVAIVTGGSQGIGAGLVAGYRRQGWAVVASARKIKAAEDPDLLTVEGDLAEPATADRIVDQGIGQGLDGRRRASRGETVVTCNLPGG